MRRIRSLSMKVQLLSVIHPNKLRLLLAWIQLPRSRLRKLALLLRQVIRVMLKSLNLTNWNYRRVLRMCRNLSLLRKLRLPLLRKLSKRRKSLKQRSRRRLLRKLKRLLHRQRKQQRYLPHLSKSLLRRRQKNRPHLLKRQYLQKLKKPQFRVRNNLSQRQKSRQHQPNQRLKTPLQRK